MYIVHCIVSPTYTSTPTYLFGAAAVLLHLLLRTFNLGRLEVGVRLRFTYLHICIVVSSYLYITRRYTTTNRNLPIYNLRSSILCIASHRSIDLIYLLTSIRLLMVLYFTLLNFTLPYVLPCTYPWSLASSFRIM